MPTIPQVQNFNAPFDQILNAVRNSASSTYQERVPEATKTNLKDVWSGMSNYQAIQNEFLSALVNRIARVIVTSKSYSNPLKKFKKGTLEYGETVEEVFVAIAKAHPFDPELAENEVFKREIPDVGAVFHRLNYKNFYKSTVSNEQLRQAFLSSQGISDLISRIVDQLYTGSEFDEFIIMKQLIVEGVKNGKVYPVTIPAVTSANAKSIVSTIKAVSNKLEFISNTYNAMGVLTYSKKPNQILIMDAAFDAIIDVEVLASAFNMEKAEFMGQRVLIDNFGELTGVVAALVDTDWFMVFDNLITFTENYNGQGLYWNYFYHVWKTFSTSPFSNAIIFTTQASSVTGVTITPSTSTVVKGGIVKLTAKATGTGTGTIVPQAVTWAIGGTENVSSTINYDGTVNVGKYEKNTTLTITATSIYNGTVSASATITVS